VVESDLQEEGNVSFGVVVLMQIELLGDGGVIPFRIEEMSKDSFWPAGDDDAKGKGRVG
jgi:hypothetical protein